MHCTGCETEWSRTAGDACLDCGQPGVPGFPSSQSGFEDTAGRWRPDDDPQNLDSGLTDSQRGV